MSHDYHEGLPGYSPGQLLVDGCKECEHRANNIPLALRSMDRETYERALGRALKMSNEGLPDVSQAEWPVLEVIGVIMDRAIGRY